MAGADLDNVMREVVRTAADHIPRDPERPSLRERLIEEALISAWERETGGGQASRGKLLPVPDWNPQPTHTDFVAARPGERFPSVIAEVKVDDLDQTLWDLFKLLSVARGTESVQRCYLIVAGYSSRWEKVQCGELYAPDLGVCSWKSAPLFSKWRRAWEELLRGGSGRPVHVDAEFRTTFVGGYPIPAFASDGYELRCVALESMPDGGWLEFDGDWPRA